MKKTMARKLRTISMRQLKLRHPPPLSVVKQQKVQKENIAVASGKKRDSKSTPSTLKKKARKSTGGDKVNPFARK